MKGFDRTVLPRWQYPELYEFKDETLRLQELVDKKEQEDYYAKHPEKKPK
jgi:hypothetical protein